MKYILLIVLILLQGCSSAPTKLGSGESVRSSFHFNENHVGFDKESFIYAAEIADVSYVHDPLKAEQLLTSESSFKMDCVDLVNIKDSDRRVLLTRKNKNLFISINGTETTLDVWHDLKYKSYETINQNTTNPYRDLPPGAGGFRRIFADIREPFIEAVKNSPCYKGHENSNKYFTGHSLGAAIGIIAAHVLCTSENICFDGMYLFAPPLVTSSEVYSCNKKSYPEGRIFAIQNYRDYIVRAGDRATFQQPGKFYILENNKFYEFDKSKPYPTYTLREKITFQVIKDHRIRNYIKAIEAVEIAILEN